jgi:hypothetical protein
MNNPVIFFYAKVYQYFNHVGIKTINLHAQASFIFSVTAFYYVYEFVNLIGLELSAPMKFALLLIEPTIHIAAYLYFNKKNVEQQLTSLAKSEDSNSNVASSLMTVALVLPMMIFFTQILFR